MRYFGRGLDPTLDLELSVKPIIYELVRTQVCFPNLKLLVDKIVVVTVPDVDELSGNEAYKLTLTDGEKTIQALLKRRIYKIIYNEDVREGSYVILKVYHLARGKRLNGKGNITYIVIEDFYSIGEDDRYDLRLEPIQESFSSVDRPDDVEAEENGKTTAKPVPDTGGQGNHFGAEALANPDALNLLREHESQDENVVNEKFFKDGTPTPPSSQQLREAMKRKWDTALDEIDANDTYRLSKYRKLEEARAKEAQAAADASAKALLIRFQSLPTTPLITLTGENKQRNTKHDVLALIISVSTDIIKRPGLPPKRDLRIMDISTIKKVSLSVFASAESFCPEPGTVALFKHLTTHDHDGGSLNAYPKDCDGKEWFIPNPPGFENGEVAQLKDCWARLQFSEQVARESADSFSQTNAPLDVPEEEDIAGHLDSVSGKKHLTCFYWAKNGACRYTDDECAYAHYNTGIVARDPMHNQPVSTVVQGNSTDNNTQQSGLPPSRSLTCFFWARNRKCKRSDEECSYAHYDTGTVARAPPGITVFESSEDTTPLTKTFTCYFWNRNGRCSRSDEECAYAHYHTGTVAYPPPAVAASLSGNPYADDSSNAKPETPLPSSASSSTVKPKSLTCFFWARNGHCNRSDSECAYAHYDTGVVAHNPNPAIWPEVKQSAIPRFKNISTATPVAASVPPPQEATITVTTSAITSVVPNTSGRATPSVPPPLTSIPPIPRPAKSTISATNTTPTIASTNQTPIPPPPPPPPPPHTTTAVTTSNNAPTSPSVGAGAASETKTQTPFPPLKHLTCYFWANFGRCKRSDDQCSYAHFHTGKVAVNPVELRRQRIGGQ
ncbi:MAG: hypothetical protein L6R41_007863 [Letrouitia leprolyta]|nr:MAG: hypothetical protein L6R41_007863 [Letrouitia leprolyta]